METTTGYRAHHLVEGQPSAHVRRAALLVAGVGPLLFLTVALVEGSIRAGYHPLASPISALALGPRGWIQTLNFALLAVSFLSFAAVLRSGLRGGAASTVGPVVLVLMSLGVFGAAAFPLDPPGVPPTLSGQMHRLFSVMLVFLMMPIACFIVARGFASAEPWRGYAVYTVGTGLFCAVVFAAVMLLVSPPGQPPRVGNGYFGLLQRLDILAFFVWMSLVSLRAYRLLHGQVRQQ